MSGRNGRAVSVRKTEAIVSYQRTKRPRSRADTFAIEAVLFLSGFCTAFSPVKLPEGERPRKVLRVRINSSDSNPVTKHRREPA